MEALERLLVTTRFEQPDRIPWIPLVFGAAHSLIGCSLNEYLHKPQTMCWGQITARKMLNSDALFVFADNALEAEALGCRLDYTRQIYPYVREPLFKEWLPKTTLSTLDGRAGGRIPLMLEVCSRLRKLNTGYPVIAHVTGPVTIAAQLMGMEDFLFFAADYPERLPSLFRETGRAVLGLALAFREAGADAVLMGDPCASPSFLPAAYYRPIILPEHRKLFTALSGAGYPLRWLMVTGNTREIIPALGETGANILTLDYMVPLDKAWEQLKPSGAVIAGNLLPHLFARSTGGELLKERSDLLKVMQRKANFWLSTGCELPLEANWRMLQRLGFE